jgi:hypothetical protein
VDDAVVGSEIAPLRDSEHEEWTSGTSTETDNSDDGYGDSTVSGSTTTASSGTTSRASSGLVSGSVVGSYGGGGMPYTAHEE